MGSRRDGRPGLEGGKRCLSCLVGHIQPEARRNPARLRRSGALAASTGLPGSSRWNRANTAQECRRRGSVSGGGHRFLCRGRQEELWGVDRGLTKPQHSFAPERRWSRRSSRPGTFLSIFWPWKVAPALAAGCTFVAKPPSRAPACGHRVHQSRSRLPGCPRERQTLCTGRGNEVGAELVENPFSRKNRLHRRDGDGPLDHGPCRGTDQARPRWSWAASRPSSSVRMQTLMPPQPPAPRGLSPTWARSASASTEFMLQRRSPTSSRPGWWSARAASRSATAWTRVWTWGPCSDRAQREKTKEHVADALAKGAQLLCGGSEPEGEGYQKGFFFLPTVLCRADHSMRVMRGGDLRAGGAGLQIQDARRSRPSLPTTRSMALAAYLFTSDLKTAICVSERLGKLAASASTSTTW